MGRKTSKGGAAGRAPPLNVAASLTQSTLPAPSATSTTGANAKGSPSSRHPPPYQQPFSNHIGYQQHHHQHQHQHPHQAARTPPQQQHHDYRPQPGAFGNGTRPLYPRTGPPDQFSPSTLSDESSDADSSDSESPPLSTSPESPLQIPRRPMMRVDSPPVVGESFEVESCGNFDPTDSDYEDALKPYAIEYPESERSRSRSRCAPRRRRSIDPAVVEGMGNMRCGDGSSDEEYDPDDRDFQNFLRQQKEMKRRKRVSHGSSIGKRTVSERSDSDREDLKSTDGRDSPAGDRRTRRRVERWSGLYVNSPPERIPELEEPNTDDEVDLARELPFCDTDLEIMEVDSD